MTALIVALILVPVLDQTVKVVVRHRLQPGSIPLGPLGQLRVVHTQIWMRRAPRRLSLRVLWSLWIVAAGALTILCVLVPPLGWSAGMLLGGSLSHAVETSRRGSICDFVCLRFWPAFNLADVAVTVGAFGMMAKLVFFITMGTAWL